MSPLKTFQVSSLFYLQASSVQKHGKITYLVSANRSLPNFCFPGAVHDVMTHAKFGEDRIRVLVL